MANFLTVRKHSRLAAATWTSEASFFYNRRKFSTPGPATWNLQDSYSLGERKYADFPQGEAFTLNLAPDIPNPIPDQFTLQDDLFDYTFPADTFDDPELDPLTYTAEQADGSALPSWLNFVGGIRRFLGTPGAADVDTYYLRVGANDGFNTSYSYFFLVVGSVNDAPIVTNPIPDQVATANNDFGFIFASNTFDDPDKITQILELLRCPLDEGVAMSLSRDISGNDNMGTWMSNVTMLATISSKITFDNPGSLSFVPPAYIDFGVVANLDALIHTWSAGFLYRPRILAGSEILIGHVADNSRGWAVSREGSEIRLNKWGAAAHLTTSGANLIAGIYYYIGVAVLANSDARFYAYGSDDSVFIQTVAASAVQIIPTSALAFRFGSPVSGDTIDGLLDYVQVWDRIVSDAEFATLGGGALLADPEEPGEELTYTAAQSNGDPLPDWLTFNAVTREFTGIPTDDDVGSIEVKVVADDGNS